MRKVDKCRITTDSTNECKCYNLAVFFILPLFRIYQGHVILRLSIKVCIQKSLLLLHINMHIYLKKYRSRNDFSNVYKAATGLMYHISTWLISFVYTWIKTPTRWVWMVQCTKTLSWHFHFKFDEIMEFLVIFHEIMQWIVQKMYW